MAFFLALDVGGTKTDYVLADETRELARTRSGTIKRMRTDAASASTHLDAALADLTAQSGVSMQQITQTCIGTAGETVPLVTDWLKQAFAARVSGDLLLLGDVEIALDAAFPGASGVLVLAGTGSNIAGRTSDGQLTGAGGWGPALADQGSGHKIGLAALRASFLARDESKSTLLTEEFLSFWKLNDGAAPPLDLLIEYANSIPSPDFSQLVPLVLKCAQQGDAVAGQVLRSEGEDLGYLVRLVLRRLVAANPASDPTPPIAFAGSVMQHVHPVRDALIADVRREFPKLRALYGVVDPLDGALWRARHAKQ
jgi:N-acetylglucosamine kinase-like BadF-type ATPase